MKTYAERADENFEKAESKWKKAQEEFPPASAKYKRAQEDFDAAFSSLSEQ